MGEVEEGEEVTVSANSQRGIVTAATAMAAVLTVATIAVSGYLLVIGQQWVVHTGGAERLEHRPYPLALLPLAAGALLLLGLWTPPRRPLAWVGLLFLALFGGLTAFSVGLPYLAVAVLLLPLLALLQFFGPHQGGGRSPAPPAASRARA